MKYHAIVVLAGGIQEDGNLAQNAKMRVQKAQELFDQKLAPYIVMSGKWSSYWKSHQPPWTEAEAMKRYAVKLGIPASNILKEEHSHDTTTNAYHLLHKVFEPRKWHKIIIVSSDFHISRVKNIFDKKFGPDFIIAYEASVSYGHPLMKFKRYIAEALLLLMSKRESVLTKDLQ